MFRHAAPLLICCALFSSPGQISAQDPHHVADFYVAPWGNDAWSGSFEAPFATITRARDTIRPLIVAGLTDDILVLIRGGLYELSAPIVFGIEDACPLPHTITYAAYPDEQPRISGGRRISGWVNQGNNVWSVTIPEVAAGNWTFRELFVDNRRCQRARQPNDGFLLVAGPDPAVGPDTRTSFAVYPGDVPTGTDLAGAELLFLHDWNTTRVEIAHVDHDLGILTLAHPIGPSELSTIFSQQDHPRYAIESDPMLLDAPGEWYLDEQTGVLTYHARPNEDMNVAEAIAPFAEHLLVVRGDADTEQFVTNLRFVGLGFEHCTWQLPEGGYAEWQAGFYAWRDYPEPYEFPAAITFELADTCEFRAGRIAHCGGWAIMFGRSCRQCSFIGNTITDIAGNGVLVGEDPYRIADGHHWWISRPDQAASGNRISNNLIQDCGIVLHGCVGIWVGLANNTIITHNVIRQLPQIGVSVGWMWNNTPTPCWGNKIEYNHIHDVMLMLSDGGGIYTLGRQPGTILHGNLIHNIPPEAGVNESNGIFCDEDSTDLLLDNNVLFNIARSPIRFHIGGFNIVSNNTLLLDSEDIPHIGYVATDPDNIKQIDNDIRVAHGPVECDDPAYDLAALAGLEPTYRRRIMGTADGHLYTSDCECFTCQGDVDGSDAVDAADIAGFVSVLLDGAYSPCADVNDDNIVDGRDIEAFIPLAMGNTPCPDVPIGACCIADGPCSEATLADCNAAGGTYQGDGVVCDSALCPQPTGICCLCEQCERLDEQTCLTHGGTFFRLEASCEDIEPCPRHPVGACCLPDDTCEVRTECSCENLDGTYQGDLTDCSTGSPTLYSASPDLPIDGSHPVTHTIHVPDSFTVHDVNVRLELPHTWVGDLRISLEHNGTTVRLMDTIVHSGCGDDLVSVILDDEGTGGLVQDQCSLDMDDVFPTSPPNYIPFEPLRAFDGHDSVGAWTITILDVFPPEDDGHLTAWHLFLDALDAERCAEPQ